MWNRLVNYGKTIAHEQKETPYEKQKRIPSIIFFLNSPSFSSLTVIDSSLTIREPHPPMHRPNYEKATLKPPAKFKILIQNPEPPEISNDKIEGAERHEVAHGSYRNQAETNRPLLITKHRQFRSARRCRATRR